MQSNLLSRYEFIARIQDSLRESGYGIAYWTGSTFLIYGKTGSFFMSREVVSNSFKEGGVDHLLGLIRLEECFGERV